MFIVTGSKVKGYPQGFAAEYCVVCRGPVIARIIERRNHRTLYWLPYGRGRRLHLDWSCPACNTQFVRGPDTYRTLADAPGEWETLAAYTTPGIDDWIVDQMYLERLVVSGEADPEQRSALLAQLITELEYEAALRQATGWSESKTTLVAFGFLCAGIGGTMTYALGPKWVAAICFVVAALMLIWLLRRMYVGQHRDRAKIVGDRLIRAIAPFAYTDAELRSVIQRMESHGSLLAKGLDADRIQQRIDRLLREQSG